jgi:FtsP/CotA-like multicopper oxidase with cupredoxin domain
MHSDLPPTTLRGYVQVNGVTVAPIHYLGPLIIAQRDKPVRVKFINKLPTSVGGDLFIPVDTTYMGAGKGPNGGTENYTENRATIHLHGGTTPWISDGTPHQWTTPAGEVTSYPEGVSVFNVPDMPDPGPGSLTFFYSNQQSARLMFYHDHAYGITRLNVYAGEAAGYLLTDQVEQDLINGTNVSGVNPSLLRVLPDVGIPLIIQDKTFVDAITIAAQDPTWNWGTTPPTPHTGDLWFPHVYMPNQNPYDLTGANAMGRWDYGPWFWPPYTGLQYGPIANPYYDPVNAPWEPPFIPGIPNPSGVPEGFMDTPIVNGTAYPTLNVPAKQVRFRILNAANDRFLNLSLWQADSTTVYPAGYTGPGNTEVKMVPFNSSQNLITPFPASWYTAGNPFSLDDRAGGVPNPTTRGPAMIQIGTEGGFLPAPAVINNQPVNYNYNRRDITVLNVLEAPHLSMTTTRLLWPRCRLRYQQLSPRPRTRSSYHKLLTMLPTTRLSPAMPVLT